MTNLRPTPTPNKHDTPPEGAAETTRSSASRPFGTGTQSPQSAGNTVLEVERLTKDYGNGRGVFEVSFAVECGEVFGFLGPNGAGKTVTMRTLMGFIRPQEGRARIMGRNCFNHRAAIQQHLGYLPGEIACMDDMTGTSFLEFMARMKNLRDRERMHELIDYFQLDPARKIRKMSKGTKQKVGLVCAFMAKPEILLLDEPTSGLDPLMQNRFIDLVLAEKKRGATVFLSSHLFEEVERTCDRVAFIRNGRLAAVESMEDVRRSRKRIVDVAFAHASERDRYLAAHPNAHASDALAAQAAVTSSMDAFVKDLAGYQVKDLRTREQSLEELFLHLYGAQSEAAGTMPPKGGLHE